MTDQPDRGRSATPGLAKDRMATPIHPVLFFLYPVVSLLAWNIQELYAAQAIRSLAVTLAGCMVIWALLAAITRDARRAAVLTTVAGLLFFSYGHVYDALGELPSFGFQLARHRCVSACMSGLIQARVTSGWAARETAGVQLASTASWWPARQRAVAGVPATGIERSPVV